jgi:single-stranded-DNA-specific exonuclease
MSKTRNKGLAKLIETSSLDRRKIGTYEVGFQLAPRINATGRIDDPVSSFKLLISDDDDEIAILCEKLNRLNLQRQDVLKKDLASVDGAVKSEDKIKDGVIVIERDGLNEGVVGLVAGKITDSYYRPSIVLTDHDGFYKGSARSIRGVNITEIISSASDLLESFGGHPGAAGLSLKKENLEKFENILKKQAQKIDKKLFDRVLRVDALIDSGQIDLGLARSLEALEPFGYGNSRPIFALEKMKVANLKAVGKTGDHYKINLCDSTSNHDCIAFNAEKNGWKIESGAFVDVAFTISINRWRDREKVDLIIEDIKTVGK